MSPTLLLMFVLLMVVFLADKMLDDGWMDVQGRLSFLPKFAIPGGNKERANSRARKERVVSSSSDSQVIIIIIMELFSLILRK